MLNKFIAAKQREIGALRALAESGGLPPSSDARRPSFSGALLAHGSPIAVIAEYKRASPSLGKIRDSLEVEDVAAQYARGGAAAMSVLTEEDWFAGDFDYLRRAAAASDLPLLRKDFIFDPLQIDMTASSPASALLLIVRLTPDAKALRSLRERAEGHGLECVVEIFDEGDLSVARESGARLIQANARDLSSLRVDRGAALRLARDNPPQDGEVWIAASGVSAPAHLREAADAGYSAVLVGTSLMRSGLPEENLSALLKGAAQC